MNRSLKFMKDAGMFENEEVPTWKSLKSSPGKKEKLLFWACMNCHV